MDTNQSLEQPLENGVQVEVNEPIEDAKDTTTTNSNCSTFGKFKDATSLLSAYDSLQAEFTRKSQKLADAERRIAEFESKNINLAQDESSGLLAKGDVGAVTENKINNSNSDANSSDNDYKKLEKSLNWKRKVDEFFVNNIDAKNHSLEMAKILKNNKGLKELDNALEIAYNLALKSEMKKPADLINDSEFIDNYIMKNDKIKNDIIRDYLLSLNGREVSPKLISGGSSSVYASPNDKKPTTIAEATKIVSKMFGTK